MSDQEAEFSADLVEQRCEQCGEPVWLDDSPACQRCPCCGEDVWVSDA